jgi:hypothetical protein
MRDAGTTAARLAQGMDKTFFEETNSKLKRSLVQTLGVAGALPYLITGNGRPKRYELSLTAASIRIFDTPVKAGGATSC